MTPHCIGPEKYNGVRTCTCGATGCPIVCPPKQGDTDGFRIVSDVPKPDFKADFEEPRRVPYNRHERRRVAKGLLPMCPRAHE